MTGELGCFLPSAIFFFTQQIRQLVAHNKVLLNCCDTQLLIQKKSVTWSSDDWAIILPSGRAKDIISAPDMTANSPENFANPE